MDLPDEHERREHDTAAAAWSDYCDGSCSLRFTATAEMAPETVEYGRSRIHGLRRDGERISLQIENRSGA
jgi:hypothetical protein